MMTDIDRLYIELMKSNISVRPNSTGGYIVESPECYGWFHSKSNAVCYAYGILLQRKKSERN